MNPFMGSANVASVELEQQNMMLSEQVAALSELVSQQAAQITQLQLENLVLRRRLEKRDGTDHS